MDTTEITLIASSEEEAGAINKNDLGSTFEILLPEPIEIPKEAISCSIRVDDSTVWWTVPNISTNLGNQRFYILYNAVNYIIEIPKGLYSVSDLNTAVNRELLTATGVSGLVSFEADNATQKVAITINQANTQIDFTPADTFRDLIGFNSQLVPVAPTTGIYTQLGDNVANFSSVSFFLLHCDLVQQGIRINNKYTQTISRILIDVKPGSQIVSREFNPPSSVANHLIGQSVDRVKFWLTDQSNNLVDTNEEDFSCRLLIKYKSRV